MVNADAHHRENLPPNKEDIQLVHGGEEYFSILLDLIRQARQRIHVLVYIFREDQTGRAVAEALIQAQKRGVEVLVLVDAFGSNSLSTAFIETFWENGIQFRKYSPHFTGGRLNMGRLLHVKLVLFDATATLIGGINVSDDYNDTKTPAWLDYAVLIQDPKIGKNLDQFCQDLFYKKITLKQFKGGLLKSKEWEVLINDWFYQSEEIHRCYKELIENSKQEIIMLSSYFMPSSRFLRRLAKASRRGVEIHMIYSAHSDIPFMKRAIRYFYPWLQKNQINLYEWKSSILHAKVLLVDGEKITLGSYNLNSLSRYNSMEINVLVREEKVVGQLHGELRKIIADSESTTLLTPYRTSALETFLNWLNYQLIRMALKILFLWTKREKQEAHARRSESQTF